MWRNWLTQRDHTTKTPVSLSHYPRIWHVFLRSTDNSQVDLVHISNPKLIVVDLHVVQLTDWTRSHNAKKNIQCQHLVIQEYATFSEYMAKTDLPSQARTGRQSTPPPRFCSRGGQTYGTEGRSAIVPARPTQVIVFVDLMNTPSFFVLNSGVHPKAEMPWEKADTDVSGKKTCKCSTDMKYKIFTCTEIPFHLDSDHVCTQTLFESYARFPHSKTKNVHIQVHRKLCQVFSLENEERPRSDT